MRKLNAAIAALFIFIVLSAFFSANFHKGAQELKITMDDGDTYSFLDLNLDLYDNIHDRENPDYYTANLFFDADTLTVPGSGELEQFATGNNNAKDLISYVNRISLGRGLGYRNVYDRKGSSDGTITDHRYAFLDSAGYIVWNKTDNFSEYYHSLFKSQLARGLLFNEALGIVHRMTQKYPADFKKRVITEIDSLIVFTKSLKKRVYSENKDFKVYWEGFIYRRYFVDKVPAGEIESALKKARNTLSAVKPLSDHGHKVTFNNSFTVYSSAGVFILASESNKKELSFNGAIEQVKYIKGKGFEITYTDKKRKLHSVTYTAQLKKI
jgi:hypothetical protein